MYEKKSIFVIILLLSTRACVKGTACVEVIMTRSCFTGWSYFLETRYSLLLLGYFRCSFLLAVTVDMLVLCVCVCH